MTDDIYDRKRFVDGEWNGEPDRVEFRFEGYKCLILRNKFGALCGYVGVPKGHACYGLDETALHESGVEVWNGISYAELATEGPVGHVDLRTGKVSGDEWWIGFSCAGFRDVMPMHATMLPRAQSGEMEGLFWSATYKNCQFVAEELARLCKQLEARRERVAPLEVPEWPEESADK